MTPYGIAPSEFVAVGRDHKLTDSGKVVPGRVGHDRIQQARADHSIGEDIRRWYGLQGRGDFERIDVEVDIHKDGHFILAPTRVQFRNRHRSQEVEVPLNPLSFNHRQEGSLWRRQIEQMRTERPDDWGWACEEFRRVVHDHRFPNPGRIHEADLLRTAGAFAKLGVRLGPYRLKGYDCATRFQFLGFPPYECPVEIKKRSQGFNYQIARYSPLPRAVVLCLEHDLTNVPKHIDVIELAHFATHFDRMPVA